MPPISTIGGAIARLEARETPLYATFVAPARRGGFCISRHGEIHIGMIVCTAITAGKAIEEHGKPIKRETAWAIFEKGEPYRYHSMIPTVYFSYSMEYQPYPKSLDNKYTRYVTNHQKLYTFAKNINILERTDKKRQT